MAVSVADAEALRPERLLWGIRRRLARHAAWDTLLFFLPIAIAFGYIAFFSYRFERLAPLTLLTSGSLFLLAVTALGVWRCRSLIPSIDAVARLIDERTRAENRFVTLATVDPRSSSPALWSCLVHEAVLLLRGVEVGRDFPFRLRRSFYDSLIASLALILLFHFLIEIGPRLGGRGEAGRELASLAERLARTPRYQELARRMAELAGALEDPALTGEEKRAAIEQAADEVKKQLAARPQQRGDNPELLQRAEDALGKLTNDLERGDEKRAGGGAERSPEGRGGGRDQKKGEGTNQRSERDAPAAPPDLSESPPAQLPTAGTGDLKEKGPADRGGAGAEPRGKERGGASGGDRTESPQAELTTGQRTAGPGREAAEPALRPGEQGGPGAKDARFVIVQLPEEESAGGATGAGKKKSSPARPPVGNLPLPRPDLSGVAPEQQRMPLEYRGLIP